ncbi:PAS domain S-box protein [Methanoculleus sp. Wushi-C6]|uniref:histidine kinase n=1 Tax=Methanoculleus caldifontis TaxID=2651577 RepID=A0ABU3WXV4_9EURY|nr:PAS domain S-box protein [Methanoculleus sp. Wushi-C6]MDV2480556.1 PAS domain S-box protein [Methanoculleus sp. Wushi-C6]
MQPFTPALDDLLELLAALDRRLRPPEAGGRAAPAGDQLLQRSHLVEIYNEVDALIAGIRSVEAGYRRCRDRFTLVPAGCICTGPDGAILEANRAAGTLVGVEPDRLQGFPLQAYLEPGCVPAFRSAVAALVRGEEVPPQEFRFARPAGRTFPAAVAVRVAPDPGGGPPEFLWAFCDLSGQEEALRESEERYRELTENISDAFIALDREDRIISSNRAAVRLLGSPEEEVIGKSIYDIFPELQSEAVTGFLREIRESGRADIAEYSFHFRGREHTFEVRALPTREGVALYIHDISDRRQAEEALRKSEEQYRAVVESQTEMIYRRSPDGTITFANDAYCRSIGIPCGDLVGRRYVPAVPADDRARVRQHLTSLTPAHPAATIEHRVVMPDGRVRWQQWTDTAFFDDGGAVTEFQSVGRDISEAQMAREALLLANRKLNLLSDVTRHDILNRLNVLSGYLDLSREQADDPVLLEYYRREEDALREIRRYITFTGEYQDIGLSAPAWQDVGEAALEAAAGLVTGGVAVEVQVRDLEVYADPLIVRVFSNFIENSLRHGGGITRIRIYPEESESGMTVVYEDDGIGIPYPEKEAIFEQGFGRQTGLGLFLAREILAITGLSLRETGIPGTGARFEIAVPPESYRLTDRGRAR